jgi:chromosome segregation ATPase
VAEYTVKLAEAKENALVQERAWNQQKEEAQYAANEREKNLKASAAALSAANRGLRDTVADLRQHVSSASVEAARSAANAALAVFDECTERYRDLAENADRCAADVRTLIEAWPQQ